LLALLPFAPPAPPAVEVTVVIPVPLNTEFEPLLPVEAVLPVPVFAAPPAPTVIVY
jgi:hypothetical protein